MIRVAHIDTTTDTATVVLPATDAERDQRIIARIMRVAMSAMDLQDISTGRLSLADHITQGTPHVETDHDQI